MYRCLNCGESFDGVYEWIETHGLENPPYERMRGSPCCCADYEEVVSCDNCGIEIDEGESLCDKCKADAWERFKYWMLNEFTQTEREFLDECIDEFGLINVERGRVKP